MRINCDPNDHGVVAMDVTVELEVEFEFFWCESSAPISHIVTDCEQRTQTAARIQAQGLDIVWWNESQLRCYVRGQGGGPEADRGVGCRWWNVWGTRPT